MNMISVDYSSTVQAMEDVRMLLSVSLSTTFQSPWSLHAQTFP